MKNPRERNKHGDFSFPIIPYQAITGNNNFLLFVSCASSSSFFRNCTISYISFSYFERPLEPMSITTLVLLYPVRCSELGRQYISRVKTRSCQVYIHRLFHRSIMCGFCHRHFSCLFENYFLNLSIYLAYHACLL